MAFANKARFWRATDPPPANAFAALLDSSSCLALLPVRTYYEMNEVQHRHILGWWYIAVFGDPLPTTGNFLSVTTPEPVPGSFIHV